MSCNCDNIIRATDYDVSTTIFQINTSFSVSSISNCQRFILSLPIALPAITTNVPVSVVISINGTNTSIPVQDILGNNLMADQLRFICKNQCGNRVVRIIYGSNPSHFKVLQCLPESSAVAPTSASTAATTASEGGSN
jgi:hypothetical protein